MNNSSPPSLAEQIANFKITKCPPGRAENAMVWGQCASQTYHGHNPILPHHFSELNPPSYADAAVTPKAKTSWPHSKKQRDKKKKIVKTFL